VNSSVSDPPAAPGPGVSQLLIKANDLIRSNDYDAVASIWSEVSNARLETLEDFLRSGTVLLYLHKFDVAEPLLKEGLARFPASSWLARQLAICASERGELELAETRYRQLCADRPDFEVARGDLVHLLLHVAREPHRAEAEARTILKSMPSDPRVRYHLAECLEARGDTAAAIAELQQIRLNSDIGRLALRQLIRLCNSVGRVTALEEILEGAIAEDPSYLDAHLVHANLAEQRADWWTTQRRWARLLRHFPRMVAGYYGQADALTQLGRGEEAARLIQLGDALQPEPVRVDGPLPSRGQPRVRKQKTLLFCTAYATGNNVWEDRYRRWLDAIDVSSIEYDQEIMIDDGSPILPQWPDVSIAHDLDHYPTDARQVLISLAPHLGRLGMFNVPGWYRSFSTAAKIAVRFGFDKIIHIESDAFIISERLQRYINLSDEGWISLWCDTHAVPETGIQIIAGTGLHAYSEFARQPHEVFVEKSFEKTIPFTHVERGFRGGRYGEKLNYVPRDADWTMQRYNVLPVPERYYWWLSRNLP
jgi:tetratricopeptide (TPR) repeat protein